MQKGFMRRASWYIRAEGAEGAVVRVRESLGLRDAALKQTPRGVAIQRTALLSYRPSSVADLLLCARYRPLSPEQPSSLVLSISVSLPLSFSLFLMVFAPLSSSPRLISYSPFYFLLRQEPQKKSKKEGQ